MMQQIDYIATDMNVYTIYSFVIYLKGPELQPFPLFISIINIILILFIYLINYDV